MSQHFDLIAIGGGSGGLAVAEQAAQLGRRVAIIEAERLGGTCVNRGCVPKKVMWYAAHVAEAVADAPWFGIRAASEGVDWPTLIGGRNRYVGAINDHWDGYAERPESPGSRATAGWWMRAPSRWTGSATAPITS